MTVTSKLGNQPDTNDMAAALVVNNDGKTPETKPGRGFESEEEEDETAQLGNFA